MITTFQLLQWRAAIKLETAGMKHSSGRSVRKHACREIGMPLNSTADFVLKVLDAMIERIKEETA